MSGKSVCTLTGTLEGMPEAVIESGIPGNIFSLITGVGTTTVTEIGVYFFMKLKPNGIYSGQYKLSTNG